MGSSTLLSFFTRNSYFYYLQIGFHICIKGTQHKRENLSTYHTNNDNFQECRIFKMAGTLMIPSRKVAYIHPQLIQPEKETYSNIHFSLLCSQWLVTQQTPQGLCVTTHVIATKASSLLESY